MISANELKARNLVRSERKMVPKGDERFSSEPGKSTIREFEEQSRQDQRWRWSRCRGNTEEHAWFHRGTAGTKAIIRIAREAEMLGKGGPNYLEAELEAQRTVRVLEKENSHTYTKNVTRRRRSKMVKEMSKGGVSIRTKLFRDSPQDISHFRAALKA
ncbi:hypothetical protein V1478_008200 [Vespula squamosa]|uniref:Uncharacterized protein n=1 Tax=Vespula squamosa TaxID=30214 RepID=A0ABD2AYZ9_VESSQ